MAALDPSAYLDLPSPPPDFIIVYDGDCPVCVRFFPAYLKVLQIGRRIKLVNARAAPALVLGLMRIEYINIDRDAAVFFQNRWFAGAAALSILFCASGAKSKFTTAAVTKAFVFVYPVLRIGRLALLKIRRRGLILKDGNAPQSRGARLG
jgi:hypothetical protein